MNTLRRIAALLRFRHHHRNHQIFVSSFPANSFFPFYETKMISRTSFYALRVISIVIKLKFICFEITSQFSNKILAFRWSLRSTNQIITANTHTLLLCSKQKSSFRMIKQLKNRISLLWLYSNHNKRSKFCRHRNNKFISHWILQKFVDVLMLFYLTKKASSFWQ